MNTRAACWKGEDLLLCVHVQTRARGDELAGLHGNALKVRITPPAVDGQANRHLIAFLAKTFGVGRAQIELLGGHHGRDKRLRIQRPARIPVALNGIL